VPASCRAERTFARATGSARSRGCTITVSSPAAPPQATPSTTRPHLAKWAPKEIGAPQVQVPCAGAAVEQVLDLVRRMSMPTSWQRAPGEVVEYPGGTSRPAGRQLCGFGRAQRQLAALAAAGPGGRRPGGRRGGRRLDVRRATSAGTVSVRRWETTCRSSLTPYVRRHRPLLQVGGLRGPSRRMAPRAGAPRTDRRALHEHRRQDDDEDSRRGARVVDACLDERPRAGSAPPFQPSPGDEGTLGPQSRRQEEEPVTSGRTTHPARP
jgi:hypothetical protein